MRRPKFSIIIPIKNRASTLKYTLKSCINQKYFDDYEVVVSDNCSDDNILEVINEANSDKIRYIRTERHLLLNENFNFGVDNAKGEYLIILGSDDGISTYALYYLDKIINITNEKIIAWRTLDYFWPECLVNSNKIHMYSFKDINKLEIAEKVNEKFAKRQFVEGLPSLYCCATIHRDIIDKVKKETGRHVHDSAIADTYSALVCAHAAKKFIRVKLYATIYAESKFGTQIDSINKNIKYIYEEQEKNEKTSMKAWVDEYKNGIFNKTLLYPAITNLTSCIDLKKRYPEALKNVELNYKKTIDETIGHIEEKTSFHEDISEIKDFVNDIYSDICDSEDENLKKWFEDKYLYKYDNVTIDYFKNIKKINEKDKYFFNDLKIIDGNNFGLKNVDDAVNLLDNIFYTKEYIDSYLDLYELYWNKSKKLIEKISEDVEGQNIGIYGTGVHSEILLEVYEYFKDKIDFNIIFFNSDSSKWGTKFMGYDICSPDNIENLNLRKIIISSYEYQEEIYNDLLKYKDKVEIIKIYEPGDVIYLKRIHNK